MKYQLNQDFQKFDIILNKIKEQSVEYLQNLHHRNTSKINQIKQKSKIPVGGLGAEGALELFNKVFEPSIMATSGPRYWGFVTGGATPAAIAGDWLTSIYDQNPQSTDSQGDVSAIIEFDTIQLLLDLFKLPHDYLGGFVAGATMSNFTCLAVARQWIGKQFNKDFAKEGISEPIHVLATTPHSSSVKSLAMLGIGSNQILKIKTLEGNREAIDLDDLEKNIQSLQGKPFILISSAGTVNTVDFDDFEGINNLKIKYNFWWHIDAAFGGFAACSEQYQHLLNGWQYADSITIDCHKWLNVPYDSAIFLVKSHHNLSQVESFQNSNAPYLGDPMKNFNYLNFLPDNSRRLRALPVWFTLQAYGKEGYQYIVENCINLANELGRFIEESDKFRLLAPVRLNTVCFALKDEAKQEQIDTFLHQLNNKGQVFMTPTVYKGIKGIRAALVNWLSTKEDVAKVTELLNQSFDEIFK
jgi:glutamate/tyrosine decarboxylase-like PLP-dependent enzyme